MEQHTKNFIEVVKSRKLENLHCPVRAAAHVAVNCHIGNIAQLTNKKILWDAEKDHFMDHESNKYIYQEYHNGYKLPKV